MCSSDLDLDGFEPAEDEEEEEDDDEDADDDDEVDAPPAGGASVSAEHDLGEFDLVAPSLCVYSVRTAVPIEEKSDYVKSPADAKKLKRFGPRAVWATFDGEDMRLLVDDLTDCWLRDVFEDALGPVKVGKNLW